MKISFRNMKRFTLILLAFTMISLQMQAQMDEEKTEKVTINGYVFDAIIQGTDETMSKRKRKRFVKRKYRQLKKEFKTPLKNLTKTQGKILIKMIEKELDTPFYTLMKDMKGGWTAGYWNQMGKIFNYDLKEGYQEGDDPILDIVINDFDISYKKM